MPAANAAKMTAAVARWIEEAKGRPNAAELLNARIEWLEAQSAILSGAGATPKHLEGLTAFDMAEGIETLSAAVLDMRSPVEAAIEMLEAA